MTESRPAATGRHCPPGSEPLPPASTPQEEAAQIAERLAALVESRRAGSSLPAAPAARPRPERPGSRTAELAGARHSGRLLGNLLLTRGFLVESELQYALARQASGGGPLGQILVDLGLITDRDLVELVAEQLRMQVVDLTRVECEPATARMLARSDAWRLAAVPLRRVDGQIDVAVADPMDEDAIAELMTRLGARLRLFLATRADIEAALERLYG